MQLKINWTRDDLDKMCAPAVKEECEGFVSLPSFLRELEPIAFLLFTQLIQTRYNNEKYKKN